MTIRQEIIDFCLTFPVAYEDYPFDNIKDIGIWTVMRHSANKKSFAQIYKRHGRLCVNLKCDPFEADFLRQIYADVTPAYHMNKTHWNTVWLGGDVPEDELKRMIEHSYNLIKPKVRKRGLTLGNTKPNKLERPEVPQEEPRRREFRRPPLDAP